MKRIIATVALTVSLLTGGLALGAAPAVEAHTVNHYNVCYYITVAEFGYQAGTTQPRYTVIRAQYYSLQPGTHGTFCKFRHYLDPDGNSTDDICLLYDHRGIEYWYLCN
jgi:hypothetical protein